MKAIILAAGIGKRLMPLTENMPKSLIEVNGVSILERLIRSLVENNVRDIVITTGPFEEKIKALVASKFPEISVAYVHNPLYDKTNYIYSLWLAKEAVKDQDVVLLHGDLVYEPKLIKNIIGQNLTCGLVKRELPYPEKDFKARIKNGLISEIGVNVFGEDARFFLPMYKIMKGDFTKWLDKMGEFIKEEKVNDYAENALNAIAGDIKVHPVYYDDEFAMEIDNFEDLEKAKKYLVKEI